MTTTYERVDITEAQPGDELLQAGEWVEIGEVALMRHSSTAVVVWAGGGSHSFPISHRPAVRRAVPAVEEILVDVATDEQYGEQVHGEYVVTLHKSESGDRYARCTHATHGIYGWTSWSGTSGDVIAALADEHIDAHLFGRYAGTGA